MICGLCKGSGNLFCLHDGSRERWRCPRCFGTGERNVWGRRIRLQFERWQTKGSGTSRTQCPSNLNTDAGAVRMNGKAGLSMGMGNEPAPSARIAAIDI
jgi:hypothetical protein